MFKLSVLVNEAVPATDKLPFTIKLLNVGLSVVPTFWLIVYCDIFTAYVA